MEHAAAVRGVSRVRIPVPLEEHTEEMTVNEEVCVFVIKQD